MIFSDKSSKKLISQTENKKAWRCKHRQAINSMISFMAVALVLLWAVVLVLVPWVEEGFARLG